VKYFYKHRCVMAWKICSKWPFYGSCNSHGIKYLQSCISKGA